MNPNTESRRPRPDSHLVGAFVSARALRRPLRALALFQSIPNDVTHEEHRNATTKEVFSGTMRQGREGTGGAMPDAQSRSQDRPSEADWRRHEHDESSRRTWDLAEHREPDSPGPAHRRDHSEFGLARRGATCQRSALLRVTARPDPRTGPGSLPMDPATVAPWWRYTGPGGTTGAGVHPRGGLRTRGGVRPARDGRRGPATRCARGVEVVDGRSAAPQGRCCAATRVASSECLTTV